MKNNIALKFHKEVYAKQLATYEQKKLFGAYNNTDKNQSYDPRLFKFEETSYVTKTSNYQWNDLECLKENIRPAYEYEHDEYELEPNELELDDNFNRVNNYLEQIPAKGNSSTVGQWFPIFCGGVCRLVCCVPNDKNSRIVTNVTGAILDYNTDKKAITNFDVQYKVKEKHSTRLISTYGKLPNPLPELKINDNHWTLDIVAFTRIFNFDFKQKLPSARMSNKAIEQLLIKSLFATTPQKIFNSTPSSDPVKNHDLIIQKLMFVLVTWHADSNWDKVFKTFLREFGQSPDILSWVDTIVSLYCSNNPDRFMVEDLESFSEFAIGDKANSTFNIVTYSLVMWAVMKKDNTDSFYIRGLVLDKSAENKLSWMEPELIVSIDQNGRCVKTPNHIYELIGPMYKLAVAACYSKTPNMFVLQAFQPYFSAGIPDKWRTIVSIMHIVCRCAVLECVPNSVNRTVENENQHSFKTPAPIPQSEGINNTDILNSDRSLSFTSNASVHNEQKENEPPFKIPCSVVNKKSANKVQKISLCDIIKEYAMKHPVDSSIPEETLLDIREHEHTLNQSDPIARTDDVTSSTSVKTDSKVHKTSGLGDRSRVTFDVDIDDDDPIAIFKENVDQPAQEVASAPEEIFIDSSPVKTPKKRRKSSNCVKVLTFPSAKKRKQEPKETQKSKKSVTVSKPVATTCDKADETDNPVLTEKPIATTNRKVREKLTARKSKKSQITQEQSNSSYSYYDSRIHERECSKTDSLLKTLQVRNIVDKAGPMSSDKEYHMVIGRTEVNLCKIPVTRSGRVSLPPEDHIRGIKFEVQGNHVVVLKDKKVLVEYNDSV